MYDNVFKRVEEKYLLTKEQKQQLFEKINSYLKKDKFYDLLKDYFDIYLPIAKGLSTATIVSCTALTYP